MPLDQQHISIFCIKKVYPFTMLLLMKKSYLMLSMHMI